MTDDVSQKLEACLVTRCGSPGRYRVGTRDGTLFNFTKATGLSPGLVTLHGVSIHTGALVATKVGETVVVVGSVCWVSLDPG